MTKRTKRILCVLCCLLLLLVVAACDTTGSNNNNSGSNNNSGNVQRQDPLGKYDPMITVTEARKIQDNCKFEPGNPNRESLTQNIVHKTYEDMVGIYIDYIWTTDHDSYETRWMTAIASNDLPDIGVVPATVYLMLRDAGMIEDMTDLFEAYACDDYRLYQEMDNHIVWNATSKGGRLYGLPANGPMTEQTNCLFIRQDWMNKLGLAAPKNLDDLVDIARAFKNAQFGGPQTYGIAACKEIQFGMCDVISIINAFGAYHHIWVDDGDGGLIYSNLQPQMRTALLFLQSLYKEGILSQEFPISEWTKAMEDLTMNRCGILYGAFAVPLVCLTANTVENPEAEWYIAPIVMADGSDSMPQSQFPGVEEYIFVKKGQPHPEAALKLINVNKFTGTDPVLSTEFATKDGYDQHCYEFAVVIGRPRMLIDMQRWISKAIETGDTSEIENGPDAAMVMEHYDRVMDGLGGKNRENNLWMILGPAPSAMAVYGLNNETGNFVMNKFLGVRTETMITTWKTLEVETAAAMMQVIMGDDISVFDKAMEEWKTNGGDQITKEVNDWYAANK